MEKKTLNLATKTLLIVWGVVAVALLTAGWWNTRHVARAVQENIATHAMEIAAVAAVQQEVIEALEKKQNLEILQTYTLRMAALTHSQYIVVFDLEGMRLSHPAPERIGQHIEGGDETRVLQGESYVSISQGTLGNAVRAFRPIYNEAGQQIGAVVVGVLLDTVENTVDESKRVVYQTTVVGLLIGGLGALLLARQIKKTMFGLEPEQIARILEERSAMLQSVREGIIAVDASGRITLVNQEAYRLLARAGVSENLLGVPVEEHVPNTQLHMVLETQQAQFDQDQDLNGIHLVTNRLPLFVDGQIVGAIATFRDRTEVRRLAEEMTGVRAYVEALRSQTHEFRNKMQVILGMLHMQCYEELVGYVRQIANEQKAEAVFVGARVREAVLAGFLLSKLSRARELGIGMELEEESFLPSTENEETIHSLVTIIGNLVDNAFEAMAECSEKRLALWLYWENGWLSLRVKDTGQGVSPTLVNSIFERGVSTRGTGRGVGLALVKESIETLGGKIAVETQNGEGSTFFVQVPYAVSKKKEDINDTHSNC